MIKNIDHLVITISDLSKTRNFYCNILGMKFEEFGEGRMALKFGTSKINLHLRGREFEPKAHVALPGTADLCFIIEEELDEMQAKLSAADIEIIEGPVRRTGANGPIMSLYVRDPDMNLIELSSYDV